MFDGGRSITILFVVWPDECPTRPEDNTIIIIRPCSVTSLFTPPPCGRVRGHLFDYASVPLIRTALEKVSIKTGAYSLTRIPVGSIGRDRRPPVRRIVFVSDMIARTRKRKRRRYFATDRTPRVVRFGSLSTGSVTPGQELTNNPLSASLLFRRVSR